MLRRIVFMALFLLTISGVSLVAAQDDKPVIPDYVNREFEFGGFNRTYALATPRDNDDSPRPLVIVFHGYGDTGLAMLANTGLKELAQEQGYIIAFPTGVENGWGYLDKDEIHSAEVYTDDWNFFAALVDDISSTVSVDASRVYVIGFSNGGSLGYRIMCEHSDRVAGVVVIASTLSSHTAGHCIGTPPVPLMMILGTADRSFPFGGSAEIKSDGRLVLQFSFQQHMSFLAQHQHCNMSGGTTRTVSTDDSRIGVVRDFYNECPGGEPILLYALIDYEHGYGKGALITREDGSVGTLEDAMFDFFAQHPAVQTPEAAKTAEATETPGD
jgi:polyhydroxybutyrate depolymerase